MFGYGRINCFWYEKQFNKTFFANNKFNSLRDENDESIFTYTNPFMRNFVRNPIKVGRCNAFNQHFKSETSDEVCNIISQEFNINGNVCDFLDKILNY